VDKEASVNLRPAKGLGIFIVAHRLFPSTVQVIRHITTKKCPTSF
jgi:hypothetical protein